jgi:PAS domain S-box-containing protein
MTLDRDGYICYANAAALEITGYEEDELATTPLSALYSNGEDKMKAEYELEQTSRLGKFTSEGWRTKKDKSRFWAELTLSVIRDKEKEVAGYACMLRDTSKRKKDELELRKSEERYRLMVEGVKEYAIFMLDTRGHILTWNDGAQRIKGYSANEIIGKHFSIFYTSEDLETKKPERELIIAAETGKYEEEGWRVRKNGTVFWGNVVITALYNDKNQLIGFSKVTRDLSDRRENEETLRQSEERYRQLVEQVTDYGIFMMDEKGRIVSWNEGARRINGYTAQEIIGKYFSIFYPDDDVMKGKPSHELRIAREHGKYEEEGWRIRKGGERFWANVVITAVYGNDGALIGFSKVTRDLTERKAAENALRHSYDKYRTLTAELRVANKELQDANGELEQFTSIVSHDLQEPIRTIKSFLLLIQQKIKNEHYGDLPSYIEKSVHAATHMRELILNLLNYSQVGKTQIKQEKVDVDDLLIQAMQNLRTSVERSGAEVTMNVDVDTIEGDRMQLLQLMQNLVSNALKFTNTTHPEIKISCQPEDGHVKCAVSDNGIGIAKEDVDKVFEIFKRLNTKKEFPGTGIGLAICKKIVDKHNGRIWLESEPGKGTTFFFTLNENQQAHETV